MTGPSLGALRWVIVFAAIVAAAAIVDAARGARLVKPDGTPWAPLAWQTWADTLAVPTYTGDVVLTFGPCPPGAWACASDGQVPRVAITLPAELRREAYLRRALLAHELGHVFDYRLLDDRERAAYLALVGRAGEPWRAPWLAGGSPHEWFAEDYSACAQGAGRRAVCGLIRAAAR